MNGSGSGFHPLGENRNPFKPLNIKAETAIKRFQLRRLGLQFLLPADNPRMSGFYLWDAAGAYEDPKTGKEKTYKYKTFHPVSLVEP